MNKIWFSIFLTLITITSQGQSRIGFALPTGVKKVQMNFEQFNNLIVIPVKVNHFFTLKFILDTGAESAILTEKVFAELLNLNLVRTIRVSGPGLRDSITAHVANNVTLTLPGQVEANLMSMLVLEEDYLELKKNLGDEIFGIIGYDVFSRFVVDINYTENKLTLYDPKFFKPKKRMPWVDMSLVDTKPYVISYFKQNEEKIPIRLMVDTGASHALLLDVNNTDDLEYPEKTIYARLGQGLGGEIPGEVGRLSSYTINDYQFENVLVSIPSTGAYSNVIKRGSRHGTLGGEILTRFHPIFDYSKQRIYLRKSPAFNNAFEFDMSGINVAASSNALDTLIVIDVREKTPAKEVDIRVGDKIMSVNGKNLYNSSLTEINMILRRRNDYKIKIKINRGGEILTKKFRLKRMI
ncbi:MAG: aspartyl protease family protein [Cyclobacteriaceae bacterium]|nr:aspartyl protease family protein [Cyclobacteriaceae bacterium HetDA_MAG_MS6]